MNGNIIIVIILLLGLWIVEGIKERFIKNKKEDEKDEFI